MAILDGRKVSGEMLERLSHDVKRMQLSHLQPKLAVILVGDNPASLSYIKQKKKACEKTGVAWEQIDYSTAVTTDELVAKIHELNKDIKTHGILVQLPLPDHIFTPDVFKAIDPKKDVDGFTAYNLGKMFLSKSFEDLAPCTPMGVIRMFEYYDIDVKGKEAVIVGHSNIVGKPLAAMLLNRDATVTICHVHTEDLAAHTKRADIVCVAVGKANLITEDMVKVGAIVVDIGFNRLDNGKMVGDADFKGLEKKVNWITPVPGGCGPMTVSCLIENTVRAAMRIHNFK
ncbi:bifunctional 5,10-methylenetetrahydrofolate dehydrogenase/5,10-methenyltetrahydrofolate cyclohydrolase [Candidatus Gracilibacteria bacterium]|nr:bifunctional 5,10-methylenetetrahydrofolate dehydrogenase/5,10-methenyltetrahydrofolate cyclohydrolase [Candidatus Gracilibacteria bacterium]